MIKLKLSFGKDQTESKFDIVDHELLSDAITRALVDVPKNGFKEDEMFLVTVNGMMIEKDFWGVTKLRDTDTVIISPKIGSGEGGQIFKQVAIIAITAVASVLLTPAGGATIGSALAVAAVSVVTALAFNALIPPPVPKLGGAGSSGIDNSQMYAISGQSNEMRRLGIVPKVYGTHRMFPLLAAAPYTELTVDPRNGETVQYLYCIYDFGLGTVVVDDIKIGDTPLTTDSFEDFEYRLVDPAKPDEDADDYDSSLEKEFKSYKNRRIVTPLSISYVADGDESIQFADDNNAANPQELVLDFVAPNGLYGITSNGDIVERQVKMQVDFALVGSSEWRSYNDLNFVDSFSSIGGTEVVDFQVQFFGVATPALGAGYYSYVTQSTVYNNLNSNKDFYLYVCVQPLTTKLLLYTDDFEIGAKIFYGPRYLGTIQSFVNNGNGSTEVTLTGPMTNRTDIIAYRQVKHRISGVDSYGAPYDMQWVRSSSHEASALLISGARTAPVYASLRFTPKIAGQYRVRVRREISIGAYTSRLDPTTNEMVPQKADTIAWQGLTTAYKIVPIDTTKRHVFLELKIKATNQLNGSVANLSAVVSSVIPIYDADTETWTRGVTSNPAWVFADMLTGEVNKKAVPVSRLDIDSLVEWADYCDVVPDAPPSQEFFRPRFTCNFILDYEVTLAELLAQVGGAAQASLNIINGKYGVLVDRNRDVPVQIFTPRNSKDFQSTRLYGPRPHGLKVKYIDPDLSWDVQEVVAYDNGYNSDTATELEEITAFATTNFEQAWRFGRYMIAQNRLRQETISLQVDFENLICTRGDYVQITQDVMRVGGIPARVKAVTGNLVTIDDSMDIDIAINYGYYFRSSDDGTIDNSTCTPTTANSFEVDGEIPEVGDLIVIGEVDSIVYDCIVRSISPNDDFSAQLTLVEKAEAIFDYESSDVLPTYDPQISATSNPARPPSAVTNLTMADNAWECSDTQSGYAYYVELVWDIPFGSVYEFFEIWVNDGRGYRVIDTTTSKLYRYNVEQPRLGYEHGFKVVAVSATGAKLQLIAMPEVLATPVEKTTPPSDIAALQMSITNQVLQLSWDRIPDCDVKEYVLRYSPETNDTWESSIPLAVVSKDVNALSVQARTGVYFIKALDYGGNQSVNASQAMTTIPNLFDLNIIETMNEAPDFDGVTENTEKLGDSIILMESVPGDQDTVEYYPVGYYEYQDLLDLDDIYSVRLQSQIRADGLKKGELMSDWESLDEVDHLSTAIHSDWDVSLQYRASDIFAAMSSWEHLYEVDHINFGAGIGFTEWRDIPTVGDATGRIFQFRTKLTSLQPNVTPRLFDATVKADMPDRINSYENQVSHPSEAFVISYDPVFKGPAPSPNIQISIDDGETGDYWEFDYKTLDGLAIRFYDKDGIQVSRQFDLVAKGYGRRHTTSL